MKPAYVVYPQRFYVLFVFSLLAFNQCIIWLTFSPIARSVKAYYHISDSTVILLLNWGPIIFIPCLPLTYVLLNKPNGLRKCVLVLAITDFLGAALRLVPSISVTTPTPDNVPLIMTFFHLGQILNAACGPLVMAPVSQLSCLWFPPHERTRATTIAIFANNFGSAVGFAISPLIVASPSDCPRLLYFHMGLAFVACVMALIYFPAQPPSPPSAAAELITHDPEVEKNHHNWRVFLRDTWTCMTNPAFVLLSSAGGLLYGMMGAWTGLYDLILAPDYTEEQAGKFFPADDKFIVHPLLQVGLVSDRRLPESSVVFSSVTLPINDVFNIHSNRWLWFVSSPVFSASFGLNYPFIRISTPNRSFHRLPWPSVFPRHWSVCLQALHRRWSTKRWRSSCFLCLNRCLLRFSCYGSTWFRWSFSSWRLAEIIWSIC